MTRNSWLCVSHALLSFSLFIPQAEATHFRFGSLTWKARPDISPTTVEFNLVNAFRRCGYAGTGPDGCAVTGDVITEFIGWTQLSPGDGTIIGGPSGNPLHYKVTAYDMVSDWVIAVAIDPNTSNPGIVHTYASINNNGAPWNASIDSCCRISTLANNPDGGYRVETLIDLLVATQSPVSSLQPIVSCPQNSICNYVVPGADTTPNTTLVWRLANASEDGGITQPPGLSINSTTGLVSWNTTGIALGSLWATQAIIQNYNVTTGAQRTKVGVDYLVKIVGAGTPPSISPPTDPSQPPVCNTTVPVFAGSTVSFSVSAFDPDSNDLVTLNSAGLPGTALLTPALPISGNPVSSTFSWTPTDADIGAHVINITASDTGGLQTQCPVTIVVKAGCAGAPTYAYLNDTNALGLYEGLVIDTRTSFGSPTVVTYNISQTDLYNVPWMSAILGQRNSLWASVVTIDSNPGVTWSPNPNDPLGGAFAAANVIPANGYVSYEVSFCNSGKIQFELQFDAAAHLMTGIDLLVSRVPIVSLISPTQALALRNDLMQIPLASSALSQLSNGFDLLFKGQTGTGWKQIHAGLTDFRYLFGGAKLGADPAVSEQYIQFVTVLGKYGLKIAIKDLSLGLSRILKYAGDVIVVEVQTRGYREKILMELVAP